MIRSERELEDWIVDHDGDPICDKIIGRQLSMVHGRMDLLGYTPIEGEPGQVFVIELKMGNVSERNIAQVIRYQFDIAKSLADMAYGFLESEEVAGSLRRSIIDSLIRARFKRYVDGNAAGAYQPIVMPVLVGASFTDNAKVVCEACGIQMYTWASFRDEVVFHWIDGVAACAEIPIEQWQETLFNGLIQDVLAESQPIYEGNLRLLFGLDASQRKEE